MTPKLQKTIQNSVSISGFGIHTGVFTTMTLIPAEANTGIRFIRTDLEENPASRRHRPQAWQLPREPNWGYECCASLRQEFCHCGQSC